MKRTRGKHDESTRTPRKSSQRQYPYCIFCDAIMRKMEMKKSGDENENEKEKEKEKGKAQEVSIETRDEAVEVEIEEVSMDKEELNKGEEETEMAEEGNRNDNGINGEGGENLEDGFPDLLSPEDLVAVEKILNGLDLGGWGEWHFDDDMIWRQWKGTGCTVHGTHGHCEQ